MESLYELVSKHRLVIGAILTWLIFVKFFGTLIVYLLALPYEDRSGFERVKNALNWVFWGGLVLLIIGANIYE